MGNDIVLKHTANHISDSSSGFKWVNDNNNLFYENISIEANITNSILGGLESGVDLDLIKSYIESSNSILEVGAGYVRVINYLLDRKCPAKITAIECSNKLYKYLSHKYFDRINLIHADLKLFCPNENYDLILWLFSGISDFAKIEQS